MLPLPDVFREATRFGVEHRRRGEGWRLLGTAGSRDAAEAWIRRLTPTVGCELRVTFPAGWFVAAPSTPARR